MIVLRQGKAKNILENSINSALTAVETYNRPRVQFRIENYIILMIIAWTKLFHAYFQSEIGERYFYKEKNGRYKKIDGERKAWELTECIKEYQKMRKPYPNLTDPVVANLRFFIGIRNKIEHRYWDSSSLDILLFGECQALLFNYESFLVTLFGEDYSINICPSKILSRTKSFALTGAGYTPWTRQPPLPQTSGSQTIQRSGKSLSICSTTAKQNSIA